jgi:hypothetical protein
MALISLRAVGQQARAPQLDGKWSSPAQMLEDEAWHFEDYACFMGCPVETFQFARDLFSNEDNFDRSVGELMGVVLGRRAQDIIGRLTPAVRRSAASFDLADDPAIQCVPYGLVRQALSPGSIEITQSEGTVTIDYEVWEAQRSVPLSGQPSSDAPTHLGDSVGYYDEGALIIQTDGITEDFIAAGLGAFHSSSLRTVERYSVSEGANRLDLELTLNDPVTLAEPITFRAAWRRTPGAEFLPWNCELLGEPQ